MNGQTSSTTTTTTPSRRANGWMADHPPSAETDMIEDDTGRTLRPVCFSDLLTCDPW